MTRVSLVICAHDMARELPRSVQTLGPGQAGLDGIDLELIVLDNGSRVPVNEAALQAIYPATRVIRVEAAHPSPAAAINAAMAQAQGDILGLWIDGARLASPGIVRLAHQAWAADPARVIGTLGFHLGPDVQMRSVPDGYDAVAEDALLASVPWRNDGYRLFDIAVLAGSSAGGWFAPIAETNGLFMDRALWDRLGGLDERFVSPGGGYVNLDLWARAVDVSGGHPWILLGEGSFHQVHGGAATNGTAAARAAMAAEYAAIQGRPFAVPAYAPRHVGALDEARWRAGTPAPLDAGRIAHSVRGRRFRVGLSPASVNAVQAATLRTRYKGLRLAKSPFDLALYERALQDLRPATVIEIGTSEGGSAVWLRDRLDTFGLTQTRVLSVDIAPPALSVAGVDLFAGDCHDPAGTFPTAAIDAAPHPWLVIEDSAHTRAGVAAVLDWFHPRLRPGDMMVVEDGVLADLVGPVYRRLNDGPNAAVADFLRGPAGGAYAIAAEYCDFYGPNVTWSPNGWLRRL